MAPSLLGPPLTLSSTADSPQPKRGYTENNSATYLETGNPCLNLFFYVVPDTRSETLTRRLERAWSHDSLTTLKLICNLRGVRGTGKSDKNGFYTAAFWLHKFHPKTLACNLPSFAKFGYFKDFPEILFRVLGLTHTKKMEKKIKIEHGIGVYRRRDGRTVGVSPFPMKKKGKKSRFYKKQLREMRETKIKESLDNQEKEKIVAGKLRHSKKESMAKVAIERYNRDPDYKFLHDRVSDLFAGQLRSDMASLNSGEANKVSLAAKWCPSLDSCFDKATLLCEAIARKVFPREEFVEYEGVEEAHYAYRVRDRLRKEVLVPLRKVLELPEVFMSGNKWDELNYNRVASVAMKTYKEFFLERDKKRFKRHLEDVKSGKAKIAAGALLPHEIIGALNDGDGGVVAELQWERMVEDMGKEGKLNNCIAVCDVSGSMEGTPIDVCVSLGLLLSELSEDPWKGKVITFSEDPELHLIKGSSLRSKTKFFYRMRCGMNTDLQKVFDLILNVAVKGNLKPEEMIKRVFVFSDMEFDEATGNDMSNDYYSYISDSEPNEWETDYKVIKKKFKKKGYGDAVPEIVFWNLRDSMSTPVTKNREGCALVSGFSKNAMKLFLDGKVEEINPEGVMMSAVSRDEYKNLVVLD